MPTIVISMPASRLAASDARIDGFIETTVRLCMEIMEVPSAKVHLTFVPVHERLHGKPANIHVTYRDKASRTKDVVERFMAAIEAAFVPTFDCVPRIRCMPNDETKLMARN
jgi:hypothetical protein